MSEERSGTQYLEDHEGEAFFMRSEEFERNLTCWILLILLAAAGNSYLHAQGTTATIVGNVTDASGAAVPGATIQTRNIGTGTEVAVKSDLQGRYIASDLPIGDYEIQASKDGFQTVVHKGLKLTVGSSPVIDFSLPVGQSQQTVTVEAQVSQVETTNATVGALVDEKQMRELPLNGRNFEQLILLAPGVQSFTAVAASGAQGRSNSYSVSGSRSEGQALLLDGENLQTFWNRGLASISGTSLGVEAVAEFQTLTNTYSAQFGGNGAVMNSVSKSGTNRFRGSAYDFLRNSVLDARGFFDNGSSPPPFRKNQFGGSLGGPIEKNKMFFFANYEGIRQLLGETQTAFVPACNLVPGSCVISAANASAVAQTLALYPAGQTLVGGGIAKAVQVANQTANEDYILARFDYNISEKDSIFARYVSDKTHFLEPFAGTGGSTTIPLWPDKDVSHNQFSTIQWRRIISPTLVNIARISFSRPASNEVPAPTHAALQFNPGRVDGIVQVTGLSNLGPNIFNPFIINQNKFTEGDDIYWSRGAHSIKMGASTTRFQTNSLLQIFGGQLWVFQSLQSLLAGRAIIGLATPLGPQFYGNRDFRETDFEFYVNDDWKVNQKLTLNLGVRWEPTTNPVEEHNNLYLVPDLLTNTGFVNVPHVTRTNMSLHNIDPRIGIAYDPFADHKTSIRVGFGLFHDLISPSIYWAALTSTTPWANYNQFGPIYPNPITASSGSLVPALSPGWDYNNKKTPYMIQYNMNVQRELTPGTVLSLGYVGARGVHLFVGSEQNPVIPTIDAAGAYHFASVIGGSIVGNPRVNPHFSYLSDDIPGGYSRYNSLQVSLNRRFTRNVELQAAYTYANCMDNGGSTLGALANNTPSNSQNPYNRALDYGPCPQDIRHALRVNGVLSLPFHGNRLIEGWQISGIITSSTGLPFNINNGFDSAGYNEALQAGSVPRPNYVAGCKVEVKQVSEWFNPACFTLPPPGTLGNLGHNVGRGPNLQDTDVSLSKETRLTEALRVQLRAEVFNLFNHANFALPAASVFTGGIPGQCQASGAGCSFSNGQAGQITNIVTTARQIQFGLKFLF
jgi:hypothetical protein